MPNVVSLPYICKIYNFLVSYAFSSTNEDIQYLTMTQWHSHVYRHKIMHTIKISNKEIDFEWQTCINPKKTFCSIVIMFNGLSDKICPNFSRPIRRTLVFILAIYISIDFDNKTIKNTIMSYVYICVIDFRCFAYIFVLFQLLEAQ